MVKPQFMSSIEKDKQGRNEKKNPEWRCGKKSEKFSNFLRLQCN